MEISTAARTTHALAPLKDSIRVSPEGRTPRDDPWGPRFRAIRAELEARYGTLSSRLSPTVIAGSVRIFDSLAVFLAGIVVYLGYEVEYLRNPLIESDRHTLLSLVSAACVPLFLHMRGAYALRQLRDIGWQCKSVLLAWVSVAALGIIVAFLTKSSYNYSRGWVLGWFFLSLLLLFSGRLIVAAKINGWLRDGRLMRNIVIVGAGDLGAEIVTKLSSIVGENIRIFGLFDDRISRVPATVGGHRVIGTVDDLLRFCRELPVHEIVVALPLNAETRLHGIFSKLKLLPVDLRLSLATIAEGISIRGMSTIGSIPALEIADKPLKHWDAVTKFIEDRVVGGFAFLLLSVPMALVALAIKLDSPGPVLFVQERYGFNNRVIRVLKFRTMYVDRGDPTGAQQTVRNDPRITRIGHFLRKTSIDELPQLINVLKGEMSLVGPRAHALTMKAAGALYYDAVEEYFMRHRVKPGLTGWAQIHGLRGGTETIEKAKRRVDYDLWYIENWSVWLDLKIIAGTVKVVFKPENAY